MSEDKMTVKEFANKINGREYDYSLSFKDVSEEAKENGFVIVYGASDDLIEFEGAYEEEAGCFDGGMVTFDENGTSDDGEVHANAIEALWYKEEDANGNVIPWTYKTDIPHETFMMYEDGKPYCRGIVFSKKDMTLPSDFGKN